MLFVFKVSRTSDLVPPCPGAYEGMHGWQVAFSSLHSFMEWISHLSQNVVISYDDGTPALEIIDDYRE